MYNAVIKGKSSDDIKSIIRAKLNTYKNNGNAKKFLESLSQGAVAKKNPQFKKFITNLLSTNEATSGNVSQSSASDVKRSRTSVASVRGTPTNTNNTGGSRKRQKRESSGQSR